MQSGNLKNHPKAKTEKMDPLLLLMSFFGPFFLWPIEYLSPFPFVIEEIYKIFVVKISKNITDRTVIIGGVLFSMSETILYTINGQSTGHLFFYISARFINVAVLHTITLLITKKLIKNYIALSAGFILNVTLHYLYNMYVAEFLKTQFLLV